MSDKTTDVATRFVDLVLKYKHWSEVATLSEDEIQILFDLVFAAGFDPKEVVPGKLVGHYREHDGSRTGETYPINRLCLFKVVGCNGNDHFSATHWLDDAVLYVVHSTVKYGEDREKLIKMMTEEIERSVPLEPIQLTPEGDFLREYPPRGSGFCTKHTRDENSLNTCVGVHAYCNSWMDTCGATGTHNAIVCRGCHLRVLFPKEVKTYGDLRMALKSKWS